MELRQLKYFVQLSKTLNFSTAAKELFITQSTLSHQILQLENELGQPLFHRNSHEVMLTEAGQTLLPLAMQTILDADNCLQRLDELKNLMSGELNIGVTFSFACIMAETLTAFLRRYPNVKVNVYPIVNEFFGEMINVSGLIVGKDLINQLKYKPLGDALLISSAMLRFENDLFLDDVHIDDVKRKLNTEVIPINNDGVMLLSAVLGKEEEDV